MGTVYSKIMHSGWPVVILCRALVSIGRPVFLVIGRPVFFVFFTQLRPGFSFSRIALPFHDRMGPGDEVGVRRESADRLLWGTDMPFQNRFCTYRQSRDWIEKYCTFITQDDLALIMGGTAARILGI